MRARSGSAALRALGRAYIVGASALGLAILLGTDAQWEAGAHALTALAGPALAAGSEVLTDHVARPALALAVRADIAFFDWYDPLGMPAAMASRHPVKAVPVRVARTEAPKIVVLPGRPPALRPAITAPPRRTAARPAPAMRLAPPSSANIAPPSGANAPGPVEIARVLDHLKVSLTRELYANFDLFLYVSKAEHGPWAQRMYVFRKEPSGNLALVYDWPVSTGRELAEIAPNGRLAPSDTPEGYYELDPHRMYRHYRSMQWGQPMPYAMFFNWEKGGYQTGLAIHAASGPDIALLGRRSSAGCIHLAPENARLLFEMIRKHYKGLAPRFAFDRRTATMANDGLLMHDASGHLKYAEGYKVLVFIENNGGGDVVAALF